MSEYPARWDKCVDARLDPSEAAVSEAKGLPTNEQAGPGPVPSSEGVRPAPPPHDPLVHPLIEDAEIGWTTSTDPDGEW